MPDEQQQQRGPANQEPTQNLNPDLAGYPNVEALVAGYRASGDEAKKWREKAQQLEQQTQHWQQQPANPRQSVPDRHDPSATLQEYGVPVEALDQFVNARLAQAFEPLSKGLQARSQIVAEYPDYNKFEADVLRYLQEDPVRQGVYSEMYSKNPGGAMEWAFLKFGQSRREHAKPQPPNGEDRSQASLPGGRTGDSRSADSASQQDLARAFEHYQKTGNAEPYTRLRLRQAIPAEHFQEGGIPGL